MNCRYYTYVNDKFIYYQEDRAPSCIPGVNPYELSKMHLFHPAHFHVGCRFFIGRIGQALE